MLEGDFRRSNSVRDMRILVRAYIVLLESFPSFLWHLLARTRCAFRWCCLLRPGPLWSRAKYRNWLLTKPVVPSRITAASLYIPLELLRGACYASCIRLSIYVLCFITPRELRGRSSMRASDSNPRVCGYALDLADRVDDPM